MKFDTPSLADFDLSLGVDEGEAIVAGGLAGAVQAGLVVQLWDTSSIHRIGALVGADSLNGGWLVLLALGVLFAVPFGVFVSGSINTFVNRVIMLSSQRPMLQKVLVPLLNRSALAVTTNALGNVYGLGVGIVFHLVLMPLWLSVFMGVQTPVPYLTVTGLVGVLGWTLYGGVLGLVYGLVMEA
ncbi:hypothetical protein [Halomicrococcus sp. NG-SE-24]|uniref:hypothetical protein n=1 Tax=Halomicrococcus sp. NG-SE-24 TaxID=3436928 RepID=UPI003D969FF3